MDRATTRLQGAAAMQLQSKHFAATQEKKNAADMNRQAGKSTGWGPPEDCPLTAGQDAHIQWLKKQHAAQVDSIVGKNMYGPQEQPDKADQAGIRVNAGRLSSREKAPMFPSSVGNVRLFVARVRRKGAPFARTLIETFRNAPVNEHGAMHYNEFRRLVFHLGLTHREHEAECVFENFSKGTPQMLYVNDILQELLPELPPKRLAVVQQAWRAIDTEDKGEVDVPELLAQLNERGNPDVRAGRKTVEACRREIMDYFGASNDVIFPNSEFTLEEANAGRRRAPIGSLATPLYTPAGRPSMAPFAVRRNDHDRKYEISAHPSKENHDIVVTAADFEGYYTALSLLIPDDDDFEAELRAMWQVQEPGGLAPDASHHGFAVEHEDGRRSLMKLRDNKNLENTAGAAGFSTGVFWAMGPEVSSEVKRRLEKQSGEKIAKFTWA
jgi:Ca2+-binding EF-hand superfamily protein